MKSEEWPIAAPAADPGVDEARSPAFARLDTARRDFFLDPRARLSEQERALMTAMLEDLIATIADEIISRLEDGLDAIGGENHDALIARLWASGLLKRPGLVAALLRCADEQRLSEHLQHRQLPGGAPLLQRWVAADDGDLAAAAMALVMARGQRRDRFGRWRLLFDDLSRADAVAIASAVAAGLRTPLPPHPAIDRALAEGAENLLARHDEDEGIAAPVERLVAILDQGGRLDDLLFVDAAQDGEVELLAAMFARRGRVPAALCWDFLIAGHDGRLALLARLAGIGRNTAATLIADLGELIGIVDPAAEIARFDAFGDEAVEDQRGEWRLYSHYQHARAVLRG